MTESPRSERTSHRPWTAQLLRHTRYGERQLRNFHCSQAVKFGNRSETSGQAGWDANWNFPDTLEDEVAQAFKNVERMLAAVGATWEHVIAVNSYHVAFREEVYEIMTEHFQRYMPDHAPIWTLVGVTALGDPKMRVEIRVTAIVPEETTPISLVGGR